ncbi:hypothetical protein DSM3645_11606 [Blastopirellula marina DSM 3645]|uniref:Uncharacterized protein n=2 Tax=Blastopirellula marina TaxID=124 RepID=A4A2T4_9BACT|nr:hypothetical protein DSM3645_11606 [Blastopirellula marina DSM 3645]
MNAAALILCVVIAGADARETIPTAAKLSELLLRGAEKSTSADWEIIDNGATLVYRTKLAGEEPWKVVARLRVVPCPEHPNLILAGYVVPPSEDKRIEGYVGPTGFCGLIDVDRNLVAPITQTTLHCSIQGKPRLELSKQIEQLGQSYAELIAADPKKYGLNDFSEILKLQLIDPRPIKTTCEIIGFHWNQGSFDYRMWTFAEDHRMGASYTFSLRDLLASELAIPAKQYFEEKKSGNGKAESGAE